MRRYLSKSLVRQLNAAVLAAIAIMFFVISGVSIYLDYNRTLNNLRKKTFHTLDLARISLVEPIWGLNQKSIDAIRDSIMLDEDVVAIKITDELGFGISQQKRARYASYSFEELAARPDLESLTTNVRYNEELVGVVHLVISNERALSIVKKTAVVTMTVDLLVVVILGSIIQYFGFRFIKRPVDALKRKAISLAEGELDTPIKSSRSDELAILAKSFSDMRDSIRKKIDELEFLNVNLEKIVEDRTEELSIALKSVEEAKITAEKANEAKSEFLANMSHELRTPMHGILGFAKLGLKNSKSANPDKLESYFRIINENGQRLLSLLNNLLDLSKLELRKETYHFSKERLSALLPVAIKELEPILKDRNIKISFNPKVQEDFVSIDFNRILQVIRNLLSNAIKFSPDNTIITIEFANSRNQIFMSVVDNGVGIPENELETVFDKFVQSSKTKTGAGGTGLGLSISKQIMLDHNGDIWAENNSLGGSIFTLRLPKYECEFQQDRLNA